jgi:hypothetical protein
MATVKESNLFKGNLRNNGYKWSIPISAGIVRSLNLKKRSRFTVGVTPETNTIHIKFLKKPVGFMDYRFAILKEIKKKKDAPLMKQIEENIKEFKEVATKEQQEYAYKATPLEVEIKNTKDRIEADTRWLNHLNELKRNKRGDIIVAV